jgi:hypothetical protein
MSSILFVTWDGGGNVPPAAVGIGRRIRERDGCQAAADLIVAQLAPVLA